VLQSARPLWSALLLADEYKCQIAKPTTSLVSCTDKQVTADVIDENGGYRGDKFGWILSAIELKSDTQEMKTAATQSFNLLLSSLYQIYLSFFLNVSCYVRHTYASLYNITVDHARNCFQIIFSPESE
jgi:hypothetical protein